MSEKQAKKQKRETHSFLMDLRVLLTTADRMGQQKDIPEGTRYIQISDTLVNRIIKKLNEII